MGKRKAWSSGVVMGLASALSGACGLGSVGIATAADDSGGGGSVPVIANFELSGTKRSPARIQFDLLNSAALVELLYHHPDDPGGTFRPMQHVAGLTSHPAALTAGHWDLAWDYAQEGASEGALLQGVQVIARVVGGSQVLLPDQTLGNDLPRIASLTVRSGGREELSEVVTIDGVVEDTAGDLADIRVEFDALDGLGWRLARPADSDPDEETPEFALTSEEALGTASFSWDTRFDLGEPRTDVVLRFVPFEDVEGVREEGTARASAPFRVDNNQEPLVQIDSGSVIANADERRGIPIPFRVIDAEGDPVEVVFQWRRQGERFPELDPEGELTNAGLDLLLSAPELRALHHICTPHPRHALGLAVPSGASRLRLPELAREMAWIVPSGLVERGLELLRPSSIPVPVASTWDENPLADPVAALPVGDGLTALVLDAPAGSWRLRELELATGRVLPEGESLVPLGVATGAGAPSALGLELGAGAALVASDLAGDWRIERVALGEPTVGEPVSTLIASDGSRPGTVRGIASRGRSAAVFTLEDALLHLDYGAALAPRLGSLLTGLSSPFGVAVDPLDPVRLYVSERDAERILAVELDVHGKLPVVVRQRALLSLALERPEVLALERQGARLLVVTQAADGKRRLRGLDLGAEGGNAVFEIGPPLAAGAASVASGADGLRLLAVCAGNELLVGGGIEQRRKIVAYASSMQEATVGAPFDPPVRPGAIWRIPSERRPGERSVRASRSGEQAVFLWSAGRDLPDGGPAFVRALARDEEIGLVAEGSAPKTVRSALDVTPLVLSADGPRNAALGDLDGDGDADLVSANNGGDDLTVFFQEAPRRFGLPLVLGGPLTTPRPQSVALGDLDGDGDLDLVSANRNRIRDALGNEIGGGNLTVFFQDGAPGSFGRRLDLGGLVMPVTIPPESITQGPTSVAVGDLDGDGDLDVASANEGVEVAGVRVRDDLTVFFQETSGGFRTEPLRLGGSETTSMPQCVALGDLDGDGDLDLVSANEDGDDLTVFVQEAPGSFALGPVLGDEEVTDGPEFVVVGDLDRDGAQDVVSVNEDGDSLTVFFQGPAGAFTPRLPPLGGSPATVGPESAALGDLDGDGDLDLVSTNEDGTNLAAFYQERPRSFAPAARIGGPGLTDDPHGVALGDVDGDGDLDLVSTNDEGDDLTLFLQRTARDFGAEPLAIGGFPTTNQPACVALGDLDGDGDQDVVSGNRDGDDLTVFLQDPPGNFALGPTLGDETTTDFPHSVAIGDLDADGLVDLVSANKDGNDLALAFQGPSGGLELAFHLGDSTTTSSPRSVALGDLDDDGGQDIASANEGLDGVSIFFHGAEPRSFRPPGAGLATGDAPYWVALGDLDLDGDLDLVSANRGTDTGISDLSLLYQIGAPGNFVPARQLGDARTTLQARSVALGDLDGDGLPDIACANEGGDGLTLFFGDGARQFGERTLLLGGPESTDAPFAVAVGDLDGDGDQDLVSANESGNDLAVFFQERPGSFGVRPVTLGGFPTTPAPWSVALGDLDGDGDADVVSANRGTFPGDARNGKLTVFWGGR